MTVSIPEIHQEVYDLSPWPGELCPRSHLKPDIEEIPPKEYGKYEKPSVYLGKLKICYIKNFPSGEG